MIYICCDVIVCLIKLYYEELSSHKKKNLNSRIGLRLFFS